MGASCISSAVIPQTIGIKILEPEEFYNELTRQVAIKQGPFLYNENEQPIKLKSSKNKDGTKFYGEFDQTMENGRGKILFRDGSLYEGYWKNQMANGKGRIIYNNGDVYEGEWKNDQKFGKGTFKWSNGNIYAGQFFEDDMHGFGRIQYSNRQVFEGQQINGVIVKEGKMHQIIDGIFQRQNKKKPQTNKKIQYEDQIVCAICLGEIRQTERLIILGCCHKFHSQCLKDVQVRRCPLCRDQF